MKSLAIALAVLPGLALAAPTTWTIDPAHTQANFTVRHLAISNVRGEFKKTAGTVVLDEQDPKKSSVEATIETASIHTREDKRDEHLRSADFFDVAKYPTMTFKSTKVEKAGRGKYKVTGDLTLHGVTKPVVLQVEGPTQEVTDPTGSVRRGIHASTKIKRQDFGLVWNKMVEAGPVVGDEVKIEIDAELIKAPVDPAKQAAAAETIAPAGQKEPAAKN
jgi:polyisoprenoid-binding protein YceI